MEPTTGILDFTVSPPSVNVDRRGRWPVMESVRRFLVKPTELASAGQATRNDNRLRRDSVVLWRCLGSQVGLRTGRAAECSLRYPGAI